MHLAYDIIVVSQYIHAIKRNNSTNCVIKIHRIHHHNNSAALNNACDLRLTPPSITELYFDKKRDMFFWYFYS